MAERTGGSGRAGNRILDALPQAERERVLTTAEVVNLEIKQIIYETNAPIRHVYFPITAVTSMIAEMQDGSSVEVGTVGNEGMNGIPVFLGADSMPSKAFAQIPGESYKLPTAVFKAELTRSAPFRDAMQRYVQALFNQLAQSVACNRLHNTEQRYCRWMLMTQDRVGRDEFPMTQEFLGMMLGVRRASVSEVESKIQQRGWIEHTHGTVRIVNRKGLEEGTCECYWIIRREFERLLGVPMD